MKKKLFGALAGASLVLGSLAIATPAANANADVPLDITALNLEGEYFSSWISGKCTNHSNLGSTVATMKSSLGTTVTSTLPPESDGSFEFFSQANTAIDVTVTCTNYKSQSVTSDALSLSKDKATKSQLKLSKSTVKVGDEVTLTGTGFQAGEKVEFTMLSAPTVVGTATAAADGTVTLKFTVPADKEIGNHALVAVGDKGSKGVHWMKVSTTSGDDKTPAPKPSKPGVKPGLPKTGAFA